MIFTLRSAAYKSPEKSSLHVYNKDGAPYMESMATSSLHYSWYTIGNTYSRSMLFHHDKELPLIGHFGHRHQHWLMHYKRLEKDSSGKNPPFIASSSGFDLGLVKTSWISKLVYGGGGIVSNIWWLGASCTWRSFHQVHQPRQKSVLSSNVRRNIIVELRWPSTSRSCVSSYYRKCIIYSWG